MVPIVIEDLVSKLLDKTKHPEQRQHYAATLREIVTVSAKALEKFEVDKMWKPTPRTEVKKRSNVK